MNKKGIKKIVIPAIAIIVITGGLVVYFVKPQEAQPVMAPLDTQQDLVEEKEEIPEEPQEDTVIDNKEEENEIEKEIIETEATVEEETTDTILSDEETDIANMGLTEEELEIIKQLDMDLTDEDWEEIKQLEAEIMAEHPEWFTDTNTNQDNYEHVGVPSTGELPTFNFDPNDTEGLDRNATVY